MPQHDELARVPLRLPPAPNDASPSVQRWMNELERSLNQWVKATANINVRSGVRGFEDDENGGYFLGFAKNVTGIADGTPVFFVGDRSAGKSLQFDGEDVSIGIGTEFPGVDAYNNTSTEFHTWFESLDGFDVTTAGGGAAALNNGDQLRLDVAGSSGDSVEVAKGALMPIKETSGKDWSGRKRFKTRVSTSFSSSSNVSLYVYMGDRANNAFGFKLVNSSTLVGFVINSGVESTTSLGTFYSSLDDHVLEAVKSADSVEFFVDGTSEGTVSSTLSGTSGANTYMHVLLENTAAGSSKIVQLSEWKFTTG